MRFALLALIVTLAISAHAHAASPADIYNEGNKKYRDGDYEGALAVYDSITTLNPDLEYNRGAAQLKAGRLGKAAVHFRRALKLAPGDKDAQASLDYINSVKPDREKIQKPGALTEFFQDIRSLVSVDALAWMTLALYYLAGGAIALLLLSGGSAIRKRIAIACAVFAALTIVSGSALAVMAIGMESHDMAVAVDKTVDAMSEPSEKSDKLFTFHEATACRLGRMEGKYVFVTLESGISGWVESAKLGII
ncbi:MAG: tetratricopeptide repeat protein [Nitrospinae bacterium]|nr:tetratricopeptide repeat protein [Nitrospinota bacterium]MBF0635010.1 tetratricopeptide repeat protein [Nitrospinota bacterium]